MVVAVVQLHQFSVPVVDAERRPWTVYAVGARRDDERWIGWLEFVTADGRDIRMTPRETTQSSFDALMDWATGLPAVDLEGAFDRTFPSQAPGLPLTGERLVA
jgi:hypothetical protein